MVSSANSSKMATQTSITRGCGVRFGLELVAQGYEIFVIHYVAARDFIQWDLGGVFGLFILHLEDKGG